MTTTSYSTARWRQQHSVVIVKPLPVPLQATCLQIVDCMYFDAATVMSLTFAAISLCPFPCRYEPKAWVHATMALANHVQDGWDVVRQSCRLRGILGPSPNPRHHWCYSDALLLRDRPRMSESACRSYWASPLRLLDSPTLLSRDLGSHLSSVCISNCRFIGFAR